MQAGCAVQWSCVAAHVRRRQLIVGVATDPLWELVDETRDVSLQLHSGPFL